MRTWGTVLEALVMVMLYSILYTYYFATYKRGVKAVINGILIHLPVFLFVSLTNRNDSSASIAICSFTLLISMMMYVRIGKAELQEALIFIVIRECVYLVFYIVISILCIWGDQVDGYIDPRYLSAMLPFVLLFCHLSRKGISNIHEKYLKSNMSQKNELMVIAYSALYSIIFVQAYFAQNLDWVSQAIENTILITEFILLIVIFAYQSRKGHLETVASINTTQNIVNQSILETYMCKMHDYKNVISVCQNGPTVLENTKPIQDDYIQTIIDIKDRSAKAWGIEIQYEFCGNERIELFYFDKMKFVMIYGILLDNAIECLSKRYTQINEGALIKVKFSHSDHCLKISNAVSLEDKVYLNKPFAFGYTSKKGDQKIASGYGLFNARQIALNSKSSLDHEIEDNYVTFKLVC